jgi:hypothetical protein
MRSKMRWPGKASRPAIAWRWRARCRFPCSCARRTNSPEARPWIVHAGSVLGLARARPRFLPPSAVHGFRRADRTPPGPAAGRTGGSRNPSGIRVSGIRGGTSRAERFRDAAPFLVPLIPVSDDGAKRRRAHRGSIASHAGCDGDDAESGGAASRPACIGCPLLAGCSRWRTDAGCVLDPRGGPGGFPRWCRA